MEQEPNIYSYEGKDGQTRYAVCIWYQDRGQYQAPLDAKTARLTGCSGEFARTVEGIGGKADLAWAQQRARALYGYSKLAR